MYSGAETTDMSVVTAKLKAGSGVGVSVAVAVGMGVVVMAAAAVWVVVGGIVEVGVPGPGVQAPRMNTKRLTSTHKCFIAALYLVKKICFSGQNSPHEIV